MDRCVVRQAIKDPHTEKIAGYELLFQSGRESLYNNDTSAADTILNFLLANSSKIINDKPMFVTFTPALLLRNTPKMFGADKVVIQVEDNLVIHPLAMPVIKRYYEAGYLFAINDFQFSPKYFSMLDYMAFVRVNMTGYDTNPQTQRLIQNIVQMTQGLNKKCIATQVASKEQYDAAVELGMNLVEGSYVANTLVTKVDKVEYMQGNFFQLVIAVSRDEPDFAEVEAIVSRDAGLAYALLKIVNSAYFALRRRTASIRQALVTLGIGQLRHWVYMLSLEQQEEAGSEEMLKLSFLRAKLASEMAAKIPDSPLAPSDAYMMGMFSTLEYMVDAPLAEILAEIPVADEIKDALIEGKGMAGKLQKLIVAYENADWKTSKALAEELGLKSDLLAQLYVDCVEEVNDVWRNLTTDMVRPGEERQFDIPSDGQGETIEDALS